MSNTVRQAQETFGSPGPDASAARAVQTKPPHARPREDKRGDATLETRAADALRVSDFRQAIELYKRLVKQEPRPEWRHALNEAHAGRARMLAARGLFEEAETALSKAAADGSNPDPLLWTQCLIKRGQLRKAAEMAVNHVGRTAAPRLAELAAALWLAAPFPLTPAQDDAEAGRWAAHAVAARDSLAAWVDGRPHAEIDELLSRIPLRSAFRAVRLILKSVMTAGDDPARACGLLAGIAPESPFAALRLAVEAALPGAAAGRAAPGRRQQAFIGEVQNLPEAVTRFMAQWTKAERSGPGALLALLIGHKAPLPGADLKGACLDLLPSAPDRLRQFESAFGALPQFERDRIRALGAESRADWKHAEACWSAAARTIAASGRADAQLSAAVIWRHLAGLASEHPEVEGGGRRRSPADGEIHYLKQSLEADPDHLPAVQKLISRYRSDGQDGPWHSLAEDAARRFPEECEVLVQAMDSAIARKAYKRAVGFARRVLALDPINQAARRRMVELHVSHARKQMRSKRTDLAHRELAEAAAWENAPSPLLHINQGLVRREHGDAGADAQLRRGVELAGGGVRGWFRASLEHALMNGGGATAALLRDELVRAQEAVLPTKEAVLSVAATAAGSSDGKVVTGLVFRIRRWLAKGSALPWSVGEFHSVAAMFTRAGCFDLLSDYAKALGRRPRKDESEAAVARFYAIVARSSGSPEKLSRRELDDLYGIEQDAADRDDFHMANRVTRFLEGPDEDAAPRRGRRTAAEEDAEEDAEAFVSLALEAAFNSISPEEVIELLESRGPRRATAAIAEVFREATGGLLPEPVLRRLAKTLVDHTVEEIRGHGHD